MNRKTKLETTEISNNCSVSVYITQDEESYVFEINYLDGKFVSEKSFPNNMGGIANMEETKKLYVSETDIQRYFGLI